MEIIAQLIQIVPQNLIIYVKMVFAIVQQQHIMNQQVLDAVNFLFRRLKI